MPHRISTKPSGRRRASARPAGGADPQSDLTRERLLEAAGEVFADRGFRGATIRQICDKARANVAAVNYHFGGKEKLYHATLAHWVEHVVARHPIEPEPDGDPRQRLRRFIDAMLARLLNDAGRPAWHGRLMMREMSEPTSYTDEHVRRFVRPTMLVLHGIIRDWLGVGDPPPGESAAVVRRHASSVVGQIFFYYQARQVLVKLHGPELYSPEEMQRIAEHVFNVASAALDRERG